MSNILMTFLTLLTIAGLVLGSPGSVEALAEQPTTTGERPPNIILVNADDLGYGDLGVTGSNLIRTPNIDSMAADGVVFTNFYASAPVCTPSRAGLLTGRYAVRSGLGVDVIFPGSRHGLPAEEVTIAESLQEAGYRTAIIGKWHLGHYAEFWPTNQGFDYYYGVPYSNDMIPYALYRGTKKIEEPVDQSTLTQRYTAQALRFIEDNKDAPFFLYLPHTFPHIPLYASDEFRKQSKAGLYGDTVEEIDWSMGKILSLLKRLELDDNTLVLFTSDNGPWFEGVAARRGRKQTTWDGGFHVPLIARWPGRIPAGIETDALTMNIDLFPTIVQLAGGRIPGDRVIDGRDIWPVMQGEEGSPHEYLYFFNSGEIAAVRTKDWKLLVYPDNKIVPYVQGALEPFVGKGLSEMYASQLRAMHYVGPFDNMDYWLLFDLKNDPFERYSMAQNRPEKLAYMSGLLEKGRAEFEPLRKINPPPPVLSKGEVNPLSDPPGPGLPVMGKLAIALLFAVGAVIGFLIILRRRAA